MSRLSVVVLSMVLLGIAMVGVWGWQQYAQQRSSANVQVFDQPRKLPEFSLLDQSGQPFAARSLRGRWHLIYFGYSHCPDVCSPALRDMATVKSGIGQGVGLVFVTLDPAQDDGKTLAGYLSGFDAQLIGLTGEESQLVQLAEFFGIWHSHDGERIEHSSAIMVVDPENYWRARFVEPVNTETVASELAKLMASGS